MGLSKISLFVEESPYCSSYSSYDRWARSGRDFLWT